MAVTRTPVIAVGLQAGTRQFPSVSVPLGASAISLIVDRTNFADPALRVGLALELSVDAGASWLPWGAIETAGGPAGTGKDGQPLTESSFTVSFVRRLRDGTIEPGFETTNINRKIRGSLTCSAPVTTTVTVAVDDAPVPAVIAVPPAHQSVTFDNVTSIVISSVQTVTTSAFVITSSANRAGALCLSQQSNGASNYSGSIGGVSGALVSGSDSGTAAGSRTLIFGVTAPPSGSQTATMSWTTNTQGTLGVATAFGVDQVASFNNGTFATAAGSPITVLVTSVVDDMTIAVAAVNTAVLTVPQQTERWNLTASSFGCGSTAGTGTVTHGWNSNAGETNAISGANFVQQLAAAGGPPQLGRGYYVMP